MSDSESSEEGHESYYYPDGSATYYQAQTPTSPETALAVGHRRPDAYAAQVPETSQLRMTPKIAPTFDGLTSWFEYEDCIDDWLNLTTLTPRKNGPSLKNSLVGAAAHYKGMLENRLLADADKGVDYLKRTLRPFFIKDINLCFRADSVSCFDNGVVPVKWSLGLGFSTSP